MKKINRTLPLCLISCLAIAACGSGADGSGEPAQLPVVPVTYGAGASPVQVVSQPAAPDSISVTTDIFSVRDDGVGVITFNAAVTVDGTAATSVTINEGYPGEVGPVVFTLTNDGGDTWALPADLEIDEATYQSLNGSAYYVFVETPQGVLRGQILFPGWIAATVVVSDDEVIPAVESNGSAVAGFLLNPDSGLVRLRITTAGVNDVLTAGLRGAISGARGDTLVPMEVSSANAAVWGTADINDSESEEIITPEAAGFIVTGSSYFSLETIGNPDGELRGQLVPLSIAVFDVALSDDQVVTSGPPVTSSAQAIATVTWNAAFSQFSLAVNTDIPDALSVEVYQGAAGETGPTVLSLMPDVTLPGNWSVARAVLSDVHTDAFLNDELYIGITTAGNLDGELRGQILVNR